MAKPEIAPGEQDVAAVFPQAYIDYDNLDYYRGLLRQELLINRCRKCGHWIYPHRPLCPACWSQDVVATVVSGVGTIYMFTLLHDPVDLPWEGARVPFPVAAIELAEQRALRYLSTIVQCKGEDVHIGMPVELVWVDHDGLKVPAFAPVKG